MNVGEILDSNSGIEPITKLVAEIFDFPWGQFDVVVMGDSKLKEAIMRFDISYYRDIISRMKTLSKSGRLFERAKIQRKILNKTEEEVQMMCEHMNDMYYR